MSNGNERIKVTPHTENVKLGFKLLLIVWIIGFPISLGLNWQFNTGPNSYIQEELPLHKASDWLGIDGAQVPDNPWGVINDTQIAWTYVNISANAVHQVYHTDSSCYLWPEVSQTYAYYGQVSMQIIQAVWIYVHSNGLFHNSSLTSWTNVVSTIGYLNSLTQHGSGMQQSGLDNCVGFGNVQAFQEMGIWLLGMVVIAIVGSVVYGRALSKVQ